MFSVYNIKDLLLYVLQLYCGRLISPAFQSCQSEHLLLLLLWVQRPVVLAVPTVLALKLSLAWQQLHAVVVVAVGPAAGAVAIHPVGTGLEGG